MAVRSSALERNEAAGRDPGDLNAAANSCFAVPPTCTAAPALTQTSPVVAGLNHTTFGHVERSGPQRGGGLDEANASHAPTASLSTSDACSDTIVPAYSPRPSRSGWRTLPPTVSGTAVCRAHPGSHPGRRVFTGDRSFGAATAAGQAAFRLRRGAAILDHLCGAVATFGGAHVTLTTPPNVRSLITVPNPEAPRARDGRASRDQRNVLARTRALSLSLGERFVRTYAAVAPPPTPPLDPFAPPPPSPPRTPIPSDVRLFMVEMFHPTGDRKRGHGTVLASGAGTCWHPHPNVFVAAVAFHEGRLVPLDLSQLASPDALAWLRREWRKGLYRLLGVRPHRVAGVDVALHLEPSDFLHAMLREARGFRGWNSVGHAGTRLRWSGAWGDRMWPKVAAVLGVVRGERIGHVCSDPACRAPLVPFASLRPEERAAYLRSPHANRRRGLTPAERRFARHHADMVEPPSRAAVAVGAQAGEPASSPPPVLGTAIFGHSWRLTANVAGCAPSCPCRFCERVRHAASLVDRGTVYAARALARLIAHALDAAAAAPPADAARICEALRTADAALAVHAARIAPDAVRWAAPERAAALLRDVRTGDLASAALDPVGNSAARVGVARYLVAADLAPIRRALAAALESVAPTAVALARIHA